MKTLIVSDSPIAATTLRRALAVHGHECPLSQVIPLQAIEDLQHSAIASADLLLTVLPKEAERATAVVRMLRTLATGRLVVMGPAENPKHILEILHAGADDYLDESDDPVKQLTKEVARYASSFPGARQGGPIITVAAAAGGAGATLVAANLSILLARESGSCGLVECATGYGDLSDIFNIEPRHTLADLCRNIDSLDQNMLRQSLSAHPTGVQLIVAPRDHDELDCVSPAAIERILHTSCTIQPWTIVDADVHSLRRGGLCESSSLLIVVTRLDLSSLCRTRRLLDEVSGRGVEGRRILLVANRCGNRSEIPRSKVPRVLGIDLEAWLPEDAQAAIVAVNCGNPVVLEWPRSSLGRHLTRLAESVRQRFPGIGLQHRADANEAANSTHTDVPAVIRRAAGVFF